MAFFEAIGEILGTVFVDFIYKVIITGIGDFLKKKFGKKKAIQKVRRSRKKKIPLKQDAP